MLVWRNVDCSKATEVKQECTSLALFGLAKSVFSESALAPELKPKRTGPHKGKAEPSDAEKPGPLPEIPGPPGGQGGQYVHQASAWRLLNTQPTHSQSRRAATLCPSPWSGHRTTTTIADAVVLHLLCTTMRWLCTYSAPQHISAPGMSYQALLRYPGMLRTCSSRPFRALQVDCA